MQEFFDPSRLFLMTAWKRQDAGVFLLLDCADEAGTVAGMLRKNPQCEALPLYAGTINEKDFDIGPHLVKVYRDSALIQWFLKEGSESGLILFSEGGAKLLADHLRPYLECILPDDRRKMFRFYDPMIFYYFYPSLTREEQRLFMGPLCGAACSRPVCAEDGDSLFVEHMMPLKAYTPPERKMPWFISERSYQALEIPAEYSLASHLVEFFKERSRRFSRRVGEKNVWRFTQGIVEQNRELRLTKMENIKLYMTQVAELGLFYYEDPLYWRIKKAMDAESDLYMRLKSLMSATAELRDAVWGESGEIYFAALRRLLRLTYEHWYQADSVADVLNILSWIYPERMEYIGKPVMHDVISTAQTVAMKWGVPPRPGMAISAGLMFFLGSRCAEDPLQPWIGDILKKEISSGHRVRQLFDTSLRLARLEMRSGTNN